MRGRLGDFLGEVISVFNRCTEELVNPRKLVNHANKLYQRDEEQYRVYLAIAEAYPEYLRLLVDEKLLDFGNLQKALYEMLRRSKTARSAIQDRFEYVIVDEYQDTNAIQDLILRTVAKPQDNICVVGDDDQSIYRFRGATVTNFLNFEKHYSPNVKKVNILHNFRSTQTIVGSTQELIKHNEEKARYLKNLLSTREKGDPIVLVYEDTWHNEARSVAKIIKLLKRQKIIDDYGEVSVLFSSVKYHAPEYLEAFQREGVPFSVIGDGKFFDREDIISLRELIKYCGWKNKWQDHFFDDKVLSLKPKTIQVIKSLHNDPAEFDTEEKLRDLGIWSRIDRAKLCSLFRLKQEVLDHEHSDILSLFYDLLEASGYFESAYLNGEEEVLLNLAHFSSIIDDFDQHARTKNTFQFNQYLWSLPDKSEDEASVELPDTVKVMTVHQAKGLEFSIVIIGSAVEGRFPKRRRTEKYPLPKSLRISRDEDVEDLHILDERKLFYVAMSRAMDLLIIASSDKIVKRGSGPSRFLEEIQETDTVPVLHLKDARSIKKLSSVLPRTVKRAAEPRDRLSFSAINTYDKCPLRYKFIHEHKFRLRRWPQYVYGKSIHRTLENIHTLGREKPTRRFRKQDIDRIYKANWIPIRTRESRFEKEFKKVGREYIWTYVRKHSSDFHRISSIEQTFSYPMNGFVLVGQMDLILDVPGNNSVEVIDFKTRAYAGLTKMKTDFQLQTYAAACQNTLGLNVDRIAVHLLAEDQRKEFNWDTNIESKTLKRLGNIGERIAEKEFPANPGPHCRDCDFYRVCPEAERKT